MDSEAEGKAVKGKGKTDRQAGREESVRLVKSRRQASKQAERSGALR